MRTLARLLVLFAVVVLGVGCSTSPRVLKSPPPSTKGTTFVLHIDTLFLASERAIIIDSMVEWERDTHGIVNFALDNEAWNSNKDDMGVSAEKCTHEVYIISMQSKNNMVKRVENGKGTVLGFTVSTCKNRFIAFVMDRLTNPALLRNVGVHEAGHLIGLDHIPVPKESVMFPSMDKAMSCPSKLDMKQFCDVHACDWHDMISCGN